MPIHNADEWLEEALQSVLRQTFTGSLELSVFDDASTVRTVNMYTLYHVCAVMSMHALIQDSSVDIVQAALPELKSRGIVVTLGCGRYATPKGGECQSGQLHSHR